MVDALSVLGTGSVAPPLSSRIPCVCVCAESATLVHLWVSINRTVEIMGEVASASVGQHQPHGGNYGRGG